MEKEQADPKSTETTGISSERSKDETEGGVGWFKAKRGGAPKHWKEINKVN
jgi:hypothetical protein